ncbi:hypothetical protein J1N35_044654 [Gossypium stocksii]|uniref:Retrovirus-related Pol polyprotein from transposon TNT 1-94 n=1 Tax=Gossypium stocksii TaxID=47602 RepID=A0A9D3ZG69_9ROSI|nr:hypothetical protein J1N35_044654 [Gossypium stocksii]
MVRFSRITRSNIAIRYNIEKFNEITNFSLWQVRMNTILVQNVMEEMKTTLWRNLKALYDKVPCKSLVNETMIYMFCMTECESIRDLINEFVTLLNDLKNVEANIDNEDQAMLLICHFPPSYKTFKETLIYGKDELSFEDVKGNLLSKEKLDNELGSGSKSGCQASLLVARGRQQSQNSG